MNNFTAFQRDLLYATAAADTPSGAAIKRVLDEYYGKEINHGRLYPNLDTLVENGFLKKSEIDRRTNSYELTTKRMKRF